MKLNQQLLALFGQTSLWLIMLTLSGCENPPAGVVTAVPSNESQTAGQKKPPNYIRIPFQGDVSTFDPGLTFELVQIEIVGQLFVGLTNFDPNAYKAIPDLATDWQISTDGTVYTFHLRKDAKWTNGEPITAHDVVWAIQRNVAPETKSPNAFSLYVIKNAQAINKGELTVTTAQTATKKDKTDKTQSAATPPAQMPSPSSPPLPPAIAAQLGVRAIDDYTVEFTLEHSAAYFPALVNMWTYRPLPRKVIEQHGKDWILPQFIQTSGPYKLSDWKKGFQLILTKNPQYYDKDKVNIPEIHYYTVPENSLGLAMYEKNELDIMGGQVYLDLPQTEIPRIKTDPVLRKDLKVSPLFCTEWYGFNTRLPPVNNPLVRKAIAAAIDKQTLIDVVIKGAEAPATTFTRPPVFGAVAPEENVGIAFNPKRARDWLAEAGYPDGKDFPPLVLMYNVSEVRSEVAKAVKTILKHYLNIEIQIQPEEFDHYMETLDHPTKSTPQMFRAGWCSDYPDANNWLYEMFHPTSGYNWIGWDNEEFAKLTEQAQREVDPEERKKLYRQAEQILNEQEAVIIPLYFSNAQFLVNPRVKNWFNMAFGGQHINDWSLK